MKISISNLAWDPVLDISVAKLLQKYCILGVDLALTKIWDEPVSASRMDIVKYRQFWANKGISIVGIQSLLFSHPEMEIFKDDKNRNDTLEYLRKISRLSHQLGARVLVFGSPKNRLVGSVKKSEINKIAADFFSKVSDICQHYGLIFCLEPNPTQYGCDYISTHQEAIELAKTINNPSFRINLDTSTMTMNLENYLETITRAIPWSGHVHISEPNLAPIAKGVTNHVNIASAFSEINYNGWISIEMKEQPENVLSTVEKSIKYVTNTYR